MAGILGRSKSLRLKASQKELHSQSSGKSTPTPPPATKSQIDLGRAGDVTTATMADRRTQTPDLLQRPRTSSGPGDRLFHKKVAPVVLSSDDDTTFNFPIPSPKTVMYTAKVHENQVIGMALGSPTMTSPWNRPTQDTDFVPHRAGTGTVTQISFDPSIAETAETNQAETAKPRISRWKSIFGKKLPANPSHSPFYQLAQFPDQHSRADGHHGTDSPGSHAAFKPDSQVNSPMPVAAENRDTRKRAKSIKKPTTEQAKMKAAMEKMASNYKPGLRDEDGPPTPPKDPWGTSSIPKFTVSNESENSSPRTIGGTLLLDVDIPSVHMERYSVMFGSLLKPDRSSSLFVRRQGNSEKLKPLTELATKTHDAESRNGFLKPVRRATSPSLPKSPSFSLSLFPKSATGRDDKTASPGISSLHRPRPLHRSNTAPPAAVSPHRQTFVKSDDAKRKLSRPEHIPEKFPEDTSRSDPGMITQLLTPTPSTRRSFDSDIEEEEVPVVMTRTPKDWKPRLQEQEPEWEIVSKHGVAASPVRLIEPLGNQRPNPLRRRDSPQAVEADIHAEAQVSVGVARSVSVSRAAGAARRDMLRPMVSSPNILEKLVDRKPLTPTLVELKNRKSQRVQLVDA